MNYIECPQNFNGAGNGISLFLGGGITDCPDWQAEITQMFAHTDLTLLNPRRKLPEQNFWQRFIQTISRSKLQIDENEQIHWEYKHLLRADAVMFWFCKATLCPIALFELGSWLERPKRLFIGCEPGYARTLDVTLQVHLVRPFQKINYSLGAIASEISDWYKLKKENYFVRTKDQPDPKSSSYFDPRLHCET